MEATEEFINLFSKENLKRIEISKINMKIYTCLKNNEIKLKSFKVRMPD